MPVYEWEGRSPNGEFKKGTSSADSPEQLRAMLRRDGTILTKTTEKREKKKLGGGSLQKKVKKAQVGIFTRQLATMINSGLPLVQSLDILSNQLDNPTLRGITAAMKEKIEGGSRFAEALRDYPKCFDELYVSLVVAGEEGGMLDTVLGRLSAYIEKTEKLKKKVKTALIYPSSIVVVAIIVVLVLLLFVIPVFEGMFSSFGKALPAPTQIVINLSKFVKATIYYIAAALIVGIFLLRRYYRTYNGKKVIDKLALKIPVIGMLLQKASLARVTRTLSTLLSSGVSILESLSIVAKTAGNRVIEEALFKARVDISEGRSISEPLKESGVFPPMTVQMIQVGESTGALDSMLNKVADFYEDDVDNTVGNLTSLLEPVLMVFLGVVLGGLIIAMYLPIFQLGSVVG
ncbi:MAG: Type II secretion system protein F [Syntrophorhabdaceae bacterium PtaU1.Bin034]|nr:MAG: Type II secretion system protein F [Syntrophorhabdaceae bacterium PtaU1.Bin034]